MRGGKRRAARATPIVDEEGKGKRGKRGERRGQLAEVAAAAPNEKAPRRRRTSGEVARAVGEAEGGAWRVDRAVARKRARAHTFQCGEGWGGSRRAGAPPSRRASGSDWLERVERSLEKS